MIRILTTFFLLIFFINTYAQNETETTMSVTELKQKLLSDTTFVIIDVRTTPELESSLGKIDGVINIPLNELEARLNELDDYRDNLIAVICKIGVRSGIATEILINNGFQAKNVLGGMTEYRASDKQEK